MMSLTSRKMSLNLKWRYRMRSPNLTSRKMSLNLKWSRQTRSLGLNSRLIETHALQSDRSRQPSPLTLRVLP